MIMLGLTGSIGMGKSTTAQLFADEGVPIWDADAAVHRLYGPGGQGAAALKAIAPEAVGPNGVDREKLRQAITVDPTLLTKVEAAIHPLVAQDRQAFLQQQISAGATVVLCDIPLLFETGAEGAFDHVIVVSAPAAVQRARVLARPGMTEAAFERILDKQVPDAQKRARADHVIETSGGIEDARQQVRSVLAGLGLAGIPDKRPQES